MDNSNKSKRLFKWIKVKDRMHIIGRKPRISTGEIWWCGFGENVGVEINGKHDLYSRPVLIFRKLSNLGFMGIPLSSQQKTGSWYVSIDFKKRHSVAVLSQARTMSVSRLYERMGKLDEADFAKVREGFQKLYLP